MVVGVTMAEVSDESLSDLSFECLPRSSLLIGGCSIGLGARTYEDPFLMIIPMERRI